MLRSQKSPQSEALGAQVGAARDEGANLRGAWCVVPCVTCLETQDGDH